MRDGTPAGKCRVKPLFNPRGRIPGCRVGRQRPERGREIALVLEFRRTARTIA
jgi:hypothetical protein